MSSVSPECSLLGKQYKTVSCQGFRSHFLVGFHHPKGLEFCIQGKILVFPTARHPLPLGIKRMDRMELTILMNKSMSYIFQ